MRGVLKDCIFDWTGFLIRRMGSDVNIGDRDFAFAHGVSTISHVDTDRCQFEISERIKLSKTLVARSDNRVDLKVPLRRLTISLLSSLCM